MRLDEKNGNKRWQEAIDIELAQIDEYKTFQDLGKGTAAPPGYKKISVHLVFDVKHDGRHKARQVADGHLTDVPIKSVYSGVISLRWHSTMLLFIAELNNLQCYGTDIGNAYLKAKTKEKLYIMAGPEFGDREGHTLVVYKALYGLKIFRKKVAREICQLFDQIWDSFLARQNQISGCDESTTTTSTLGRT